MDWKETGLASATPGMAAMADKDPRERETTRRRAVGVFLDDLSQCRLRRAPD
jgi:hypothetical protein